MGTEAPRWTLDAFVRALAIEAAREDHREAVKKAK
jgi:hypothetical protein